MNKTALRLGRKKSSTISTLMFIGGFALWAAPDIQAELNPSETEASVMYNIQITLGKNVITGTLDDTPTVRDFVKQLPLKLKLEDYSSTEKIAYLPNKLSTQNAGAGFDPDVGDITYYAPWGNLAIFYQDFGYSHNLIRLGRITSGMEHLRYRNAKQATIEIISLP
jgi:hypothetical protein